MAIFQWGPTALGRPGHVLFLGPASWVRPSDNSNTNTPTRQHQRAGRIRRLARVANSTVSFESITSQG